MNQHEPECGVDFGWAGPCICLALRAAYKRGCMNAQGIVDNGDGTVSLTLNIYKSPLLDPLGEYAVDALRGDSGK